MGVQELSAKMRASTLASLQLRPERFVEHLEAGGAFRLVRQLLQPVATRGFASRPMFLLERL